MRGFLREHSDINVEISVKTPMSLWKSLFNLIKRPKEVQKPDVVQIPHHWTAVFAQLGLFEDLSVIAPNFTLEPWLPALQKHSRLPRTRAIYSVPWWMELVALYYRKDVFEKFKIDPDPPE